MLYDLIEEAARVPVKTPDDLQQVLQSHEEAETILLKVRRIVDGVHQELLLEVPRTLLVTEGLTTDGDATTERKAGSSHQTVTSSSPVDETI